MDTGLVGAESKEIQSLQVVRPRWIQALRYAFFVFILFFFQVIITKMWTSYTFVSLVTTGNQTQVTCILMNQWTTLSSFNILASGRRGLVTYEKFSDISNLVKDIFDWILLESYWMKTCSFFSPASWHSFAVCRSLSTFLPAKARLTPCLANSTALAAPMPELAPAMVVIHWTTCIQWNLF